ncbi:MAG: hypothetical protein N2315_03190 [Thermanaerothrix sp.]|nr:hypothetical protein [Thermanaerothrix sp.]
MTRRNLIRLVLVGALVALGAVLFVLGKEHQLFLDNQAATLSGKDLKPIESLRVTVGSGEPMEFMADDRDVVVVRGPKVPIKIEVLDQNGAVIKTVESTLSFLTEDRAMVSLPALVEGLPAMLPPPGNE